MIGDILMIRYMEKGPVITVPDPLRPGNFVSYPNPDWQGMPEIISFTDFLRWNYSADYGRYIREKYSERELPLPYGLSYEALVINVTIEGGFYDRTGISDFIMHIICDVCFDCGGCIVHQRYRISGYFRGSSSSLFMEDVDIYNGERIRCHAPLDEFLVPVMSRKNYDQTAREIIDRYCSRKAAYSCRIDGRSLACAMGYDVIFKRLSLNGRIKSKLIFDSKDVTVYDDSGIPVSLTVPSNTILADVSLLDDERVNNVLIHECIHIYLHHIFYYVQSLYRREASREIPEFLDYFYSEKQQDCVMWMETQANSIARRIQMPADIATDLIIDFIDSNEGNMSFEKYRELIDYIKTSFGVSRYSAKKRIIELGWKEVRGVYTYCTNGYVEDHEIEESLPPENTYTLPLGCIAQIFASSQEFSALVKSGRYIYADGHLCRNDEKYVIRENGSVFGITEYARHHMSECCISFRRVYEKQKYSYTYGELNKEALNAIVEYTLDNEQKRKLRKTVFERNKEIDLIYTQLAANPLGETIKFHMKRRGITAEMLSERSGLGLSTISKLRKGSKVKLETILAFSVALELEKPYMSDLMRKANVQFDTGNHVHNVYMAILELYPDANVYQINEFLREEGYTPWSQEHNDDIAV